MKKVGLDHIAVIISSEDNLEFYKKLGFEENKRITRDYDTVVLMSQESIVLEIFIDPSHPARRPYPEVFGLRHFALSIPNLEETMKHMICEPVRTDWFGRKFTFTKDPDGQTIELIELSN